MAITFSKLTWIDGSAPTLSAVNLNRIENTLETICDGGDGSGLDADTLDGADLNTTSTLGTSQTTVPNELAVKNSLDLKAPLASPALTGTPTAPSAAAATDSTQVATTAFVHDAITLDTDPLIDFRVWDATRTYAVNEPTFRNGIPYRSLENGNINYDPETRADKWEVVGGSGDVANSDNFMANTLTSTVVTNITGSGLTSYEWDATATSLLSLGALKVIVPASGTGRYIDIALSDVDPLDVGQTWNVTFGYNLGTNADDLVSVYLYDGSTEVATSHGYLPYAGGTSGIATGTVIPTTTTSGKKLRFKFKDNTACTIWFADIFVGTKQVAVGAAISNWRSYSLTIGATTAAPTKGTVSEDNAKWARDGQNMLWKYDYKQTAAGSAGDGTYLFPLPSGYVIDLTTNPVNSVVGIANVSLQSLEIGTSTKSGVVVVYDSTHLKVKLDSDSALTTQTNLGSGYYTLGNTTIAYRLKALFAISQWTSNVNLTSDFQEFAYNTQATVNTNDTTSFGYGPEGAAVLANTDERYYRVKFKKPIQATDDIFVEVYENGAWYKAVERFPYNLTQNVGIRLISRNTTDSGQFEVHFMKYPESTSSWSGYATDGMKWRVRKVSNGNMAEIPPVVFADYTSSGSTTTTASSPINFPTKVEDTNTAVTTGSSWKFTAPISGLYEVTTNIYQNSAADIYLYKNGSSYRNIDYVSTSSVARAVGPIKIRLSAGDYVDVRPTSTATNLSLSWIQITRIGS